jgi:hypothetical protein
MSINEETNRAICHEVGHAVVALHLGFRVEKIAVCRERPYTHIDLNSPQESSQECFIVLAGGIAGETFIFPHSHYDQVGAQGDQREISVRGGGQIESYLPEALKIVCSNELRFRELKRRLAKEVEESVFEFADHFELLSRQEIECIWESAENDV